MKTHRKLYGTNHFMGSVLVFIISFLFSANMVAATLPSCPYTSADVGKLFPELGGYLFYLAQPGEAMRTETGEYVPFCGLIATAEPSTKLYQWQSSSEIPGDYKTPITPTDDPNAPDFSHAYNTRLLVDYHPPLASEITYPAAIYAYNSTHEGFEDWYLPTIYEIRLLHVNLCEGFTEKPQICSILESPGVWSSSEKTDSNAWSYKGATGNGSQFRKTWRLKNIPIRAF